jgi:hypothetical protein
MEDEIKELSKYRMKKVKNKGNDGLLQILLNAEYEEKKLSEKTKRGIRKSMKEIKEGKTKSLECVISELKNRKKIKS